MQEMQEPVSDSGGNSNPAPAGNSDSGEKRESPISKKPKTKLFLAIAIIVSILLVFGGWELMAKKETTGKTVLLHTNMGDIKIQLYGDMPITTGNFEKLVNDGFYDNVTFHRVIDGFMIQGGDPAGTGMGGPGYTIKDEFTNHNKNNRGTIAMANAGPNTGGSQFFINLVDNNFLDSKHPVFGNVTEGMDVVDAIGKVKTGLNDKPIKDVVIINAEIQNGGNG
jgi:peptidylprolyl isomerase